MKVRTIAIMAALCSPTILFGEIRWLSTEYDFGSFKEIGGPKTGSVQFVNEGPEATIVNRVRPSCGCTGADYTRGEIAPGDTATIYFTYNPAGRPGRFSKTVKVYTGENNELTSITIKGTVVGSPATLSTDYPEVAGPLRLSTSQVNFGDVTFGKGAHEFVRGYNQSQDTIYPYVTGKVGDIDVSLSSAAVAPGDLFSIGLYFNGRKVQQLGAESYDFSVYANKNGESLPLKIDVNVVPDLTNLSETDIANSAKLYLKQTVVENEATKPGEKVKFKFPIENRGVDNLELKRVYSRNEAIQIKRFPRILKSGKSGYVEGEVDLSKITGPAYGIDVELITNDYLMPIAKVRVSGQNPQ